MVRKLLGEAGRLVLGPLQDVDVGAERRIVQE